MNDDLASLENELRALEPRAPSKPLQVRVSALLDQRTSIPTIGPWWQKLGFNRPAAAVGWGICVPALAVIAVVAVLGGFDLGRAPFPLKFHASTGNEGTAFSGSTFPGNTDTRSSLPVPAKESGVLYQALDEGIVLDGEQEPVHRVRCRSADLVEWRSPNTGAHWEVSFPREDVVLVPIRAD